MSCKSLLNVFPLREFEHLQQALDLCKLQEQRQLVLGDAVLNVLHGGPEFLLLLFRKQLVAHIQFEVEEVNAGQEVV